MDLGQDIRLQIQTDLLTCPLCRRPYVKPRSLPCHHTFCETCVARCAGSNLTFPCPTCRHDAAVPASGVSGFPEDVFLSRLSFKIRTIEEPYVTPFVINECLTHQRQAIRFYCQTCEKPLCRECPRGNHNSHKVCHIEEQIERMKERVGTALSDQRQRSATAVTSLQAVRSSIAEILPQKHAMERHIEALVHERIQAIQLEGETLQQELDSLCDRHLSDMTQRKKELESTVETLLTFDVEAERELARGGLVDVNRHGEISEKLKIMYETMNRPDKKPPGFQATFIPTDVDCLVGYFETGDRPGHGIDSPEIITKPSRVVSHMKEHTFRFGPVSQNGHETASSLKDDWEKVELRNKSNSQHEKGIRAGSFQGVRNRRPASARYGDEKPAKGSRFPDRRTSSFSPRETQSENAKSVPYMRRQVSEPARSTQQAYTTRRPTQQPNTANRPVRESDIAYMSAQQSEPAIRSTQQTHMDTRPAQPSETASMPARQSETASRPTQSLETATSNQTTIQRQVSEPARSTQQSQTEGGPTQDPDQATMPTLQAQTATRPTRPSEKAPKPSQQSDTALMPTQQFETAPMQTPQSETAMGSTRRSETTQGPIEQPDTARESTQQSDTARGPIHQLEIPVRSIQQPDKTIQQPDTAPSTAHAQQPETTGGPSQMAATSQIDDTSDKNFVRWKTLRINSKEKVSKVLEFPSDEDVEIFL